VNEDRPKPHPFALAMEWVAKITTVALEMVLPAAAGGYLDQRLGTSYWALVGVVIGFVVGMWHLLQMTRVKPRGAGQNRGNAGSSDGPMQGEDKSGGSAGV
jgi:F0F1-type ATP synthase assembly protein I